jgi:hypothetical protein
VPVVAALRDEYDDGEGQYHREESDRVEPVEEDDQALGVIKHLGLKGALVENAQPPLEA